MMYIVIIGGEGRTPVYDYPTSPPTLKSYEEFQQKCTFVNDCLSGGRRHIGPCCSIINGALHMLSRR